jgi:hypothetical protein
VSELPPSVPGAHPSARARANIVTGREERWPLTTEQTTRAIALRSHATHRATGGGPIRGAGRTDHRARLLIDRADGKAELDAGGTVLYGTRRPIGAPRAARQLGIVGC